MCCSGFVIHYNYRSLISSAGAVGFAKFLWARFSRLYPLFAVFLVFDILLGNRTYNAIADDHTDIYSALRALPYFLTFTQSWAYNVVNDHSLLFRVGNALPVTWSISTEWFFYLCYPAIMLIVVRAWRPITAIGCALGWTLIWGTLAFQLASRAGELDAWAEHYFGISAGQSYTTQDDFIRWLLYFSPYLRIGEFVLGCITAQLYLTLKDKKPTRIQLTVARLGVFIAITSIPVLMYMMYVPDSQYWIRRLNGNFDFAPSLAVILFCAARYEIYAVRWLSARPIIRLGEASYSIYLTHMLVFLIVAGSQDAIPASLATYCYLVARLVAIVVFIFFLQTVGLIEDPARRALRAIWSKSTSPLTPTLTISGALIPAVVVIALNVIVIAHSRSSVLSSGVQAELPLMVQTVARQLATSAYGYKRPVRVVRCATMSLTCKNSGIPLQAAKRTSR